MATLGDTAISGFRKHVFIDPVEKLQAKIAYPAKEAGPRGYRKINPKVLLKKTGFSKRKLIAEAALVLLSITLNKKEKTDPLIGSLIKPFYPTNQR